MGSYDLMPEGYDGPAPQHAIGCNSKWSHRAERHSHPSVELVRLCFLAARYEKAGVEVWPCTWVRECYGEDGFYPEECGLPAMFTDERGSYECVAGHDHVPAEVRLEQGWDYAGDLEEARGLARNGVRPVHAADGKSWL